MIVELESLGKSFSSSWSIVTHSSSLGLVLGMFVGLSGHTHVDLKGLEWVSSWKSSELVDALVDSVTLFSESESPGLMDTGGAVYSVRSKVIFGDESGHGVWVLSIVVGSVSQVLDSDVVSVA